ncbi:hypothetical protein LDG_7641 [Legionella drancourtii LLAP12]|uniref:Uncharacterized protein n=1 Tax=Legionella drancourtii LLAP12 TaxID=658187 RepID=G9EQT8_9GAMM|nr:hypothetical protein LDG_7641 [Legionella drancourtii LLAP12]
MPTMTATSLQTAEYNAILLKAAFLAAFFVLNPDLTDPN